MCADKLPQYVDPSRLARAKARLVGHVPLSSCERLGDLLADNAGQVDVILDFTYDEQRRICVTGELTANLQLFCQRCLQAVQWPLKHSCCLSPVATEEAADKLVSDYEPWLVVEGKKACLWTMIEDELLLSLPVVAMHPRDVCGLGNEYSSDSEEF